jgi:phosphoglycerate dehydrogenase-like enzyme
VRDCRHTGLSDLTDPGPLGEGDTQALAEVSPPAARYDDRLTEGGQFMPLAWVPYTGLAEAERRLGRIPDGLELDFYRADGDDFPATAGEVAFYVLPYLKGTAVLDKVRRMPRLEVVQTLTAGYEDVLPLIPDRVTLCNAAGLHDASTAELAVALALASGRHLDWFARDQVAGNWKHRAGRSLADQRVLIVGYGHIGAAIEARLQGFEVASVTRVSGRGRSGPPLVHPVGNLPGLLPEADVVFVTAPHTPQTEGMFGARELGLLPNGALLVNVARGKLVDTPALLAELSSGRITAALDVTDPEPLPRGHPLWRAPGVLISPHVGGASSAFAPRADRLMAAQLARFAAGQPLSNVVRPGSVV